MIRALLALMLLGGAQAKQESPVGVYDGGGFEMAAGLELTADGRFRYAMSVGALDETAEGRWRIEHGRVLLTSDPVTPPEIALVARAPGEARKLHVALDVPRGVNRQYFDVRIDGPESAEEQMAEDGLTLPLSGDHALKVSVVLGMYDVVSAPVEVDPARGARLNFRFTPNDIGKLDLRDAALARDGDRYVLDRGGQPMRFRKIN